MQGALAETSPVDLCLRLGRTATGMLTLHSPRGEATLQFLQGDLAAARSPATSQGRGTRLGERLVHAGRLDRPDLDAALDAQSSSSPPVALGQLLVDRGLVSADVVRVFLQEQVIDSLMDVIGWFEGTFTFDSDLAASSGVLVSIPIHRALMEVRRRTAERDRVMSVVVAPTAVPRPVPRPTPPTSLSADAFTVLTAVDGLRSVGSIAASLGYAYDETSRLVYRLTLQGLVTFAESDRVAPALTEPTLATPSAPAPPVPLSDTGWADLRQGASTTAVEPEPWVGWANPRTDTDRLVAQVQIPPAPSVPGTTSGPRVDDDMRRALISELHAMGRADGPTPPTPPAAAPREVTEPPVPAPAAGRVAPVAPPQDDHDMRRALFSELHAMGRAEPTAPTAPPQPPAAPSPPPAAAPTPAAPDTPPTPPAATLSSNDLSDLLAELHGLHSDDDRRDGR